MRERAEVVADELDSRVPLRVLALCGKDLRVGHEPYLDEESLDGAVGNAPNKRAERDRDDAERETNTPFAATDASHLEGGATDEHDENLNSNLCNSNVSDSKPAKKRKRAHR